MENRQKKILVVGDNHDNLITLKALIQKVFIDIVVFTTCSRKEAIELARAQDPDVILVNIFMPLMDGFCVCQALKTDEILQSIPVVFVTAPENDKKWRIRALEAGAEGFINTPIDESELASQIRAMVKIRSSHLRSRDEEIRIEVLVAERISKLRKELEEQILSNATLSKSERKYRTIADSGEALIWTSGSDKLCDYFNEPWLQFTGRTLEQELGNGWTEGVFPSDFERCLDTYITAFDKHEGFIMEYRLHHATGGYRWIIDNGTPRFDSEGNFLGYIGHCLDITERKSAELKLELAANIVQNIQVGLHIYKMEKLDDDRSLRLVFANPASAEYTGVRVEDVVGKTIDEISPGLRTKGFPQKFADVIRTKMLLAIDDIYYGDNRVIEGAFSVKAFPLPDNQVGIIIENVTQSKQNEESLRENEKKYSSLFSSMLEGVALHEIICDTSGNPVDYRFLDINPAFEKLTGLKKADIVGKTVLTILPTTEQFWIETYGKVALTGEPVAFENFSSALNKYYHVVAFCPQTNKVAVIFNDITERILAENALRESEEKQNAMISNISDVIGVIGIDGIVKYKSPNIENWFGWRSQDLVGKQGLLMIHPDDLERVQKEFVTLLEIDNSVLTIECRYKCKNGSYKPVQLTATNLTNNPVICGVLLNYHDITRRKRAEEALRENEVKFRTIFQQSPLGIALIDSESGQICEINPRFAEISGRTQKEMMFTDQISITHPEDVQEHLGKMALMNTGKTPGFTMKKRYVHPDGSHVWINMTIAPMPVENKGKKHQVCMIEDITEKHLIESRLRQSEKMEAIGQLAGGIAHDFNNILGGIIGYTDLSLDLVGKDSLIEKNLRKIIKASERAKQLVQQILTFSRTGNQQKSVIAVYPIIKEVLELLRATIPSSVIIESNLLMEAKPILGDPTKIHEMILNLATNSVYAMDRKGVLRVQLYPLVLDCEIYSRTGKITPGEYTVIEVTDTGYGMDVKTLQKAFDPFFTTKPVGVGTGMGLSVVLGVVQLHGGDVQVESEPGKGTTFKIYLPVSGAKLEQDCTDKDSPDDFKCGKENVLFVDDEQALVDLSVDILRSLGYKVTGFSDSVLALKFVEEKANDIDILITDQTMPGMTGVELAKAALKIRKNLPVILCTGYSAEINPERAAAIGISQLAMKPLRLRQFAEMLRKALDNKQETTYATNTGN
jgi:PAS domain S-box-containing protein